MPAPICVECQVECVCQKNAQLFHDLKIADCPSTYWSGDVWECPCCRWRVAVGFQTKGMCEEDQRALDRNPDESIVFAYTPSQLTKYADQFQKSEIEDVETYTDSTGRSIKVGDRVRFRGSLFTIAEFLLDHGRGGAVGIRFTEKSDTDEMPDELSVDLFISVSLASARRVLLSNMR